MAPVPPPGDAREAVVMTDDYPAPDTLSPEARQVWWQLAPLAVKRKTLTKSTAFSFELLCRNVVLEREIAKDLSQAGGANHRGIIQRVDAELLRFDLSPNGKPHGEAAEAAPKPKSPLEKLKERRRSLHAVR